jgi:hypothetical protein
VRHPIAVVAMGSSSHMLFDFSIESDSNSGGIGITPCFQDNILFDRLSHFLSVDISSAYVLF